MYLLSPPTPHTSIIYSSPEPRCCCVVWPSATNAAAWHRHRMIIVPISAKGVNHIAYPSPCVHSCMVCVCVCATVCYAIGFRHSRRFNYRPQFQDRQSPHPRISRRAQYGDDIIGRELNIHENCSVGSGSRTPQPSEKPTTIKTSASTETATTGLCVDNAKGHVYKNNPSVLT